MNGMSFDRNFTDLMMLCHFGKANGAEQIFRRH